MNRIRPLLILLLLAFPLMAFCQDRGVNYLEDKPLRIEVQASSDKETYRIIPCGDAGMILFYQSVEQTAENAIKWYFSLYDKNLQQIWVRNAPVGASLTFRNSALIGETLHLFFESPDKKKSQQLDFQILRIRLTDGSLVINNGTFIEPSSVVDFFIQEQKAYIGLNRQNGFPTLLILDLPTGVSTEVPLLSEMHSTLMSLAYSTVTGEALAMVQQQISRQAARNLFLRLDLMGRERIRTAIETSDPSVRFDDPQLIAISPDTVLIMGSWYREARSKKTKSNETTGLYSMVIDQGIAAKPTLINFLELKNIRQLLSERDILALRKKSMKKQRSGEEYSLDLMLVMHDIIPGKDTFLLAMESYYPQFRTESFTDYDFYGRPYTNSYNVFDGYRFTGFLVVAFSGAGWPLWDNTMDFRNLVTYSLEPVVSLFPSGNEIVLAYLSEGKIASKIIEGEKTIENTTYSDIRLMSPNEKLLNEAKSRMVHWYDDFFLCYGYQEIRDISITGTGKRMVFFCNKVRFER